MGSSNRSSGDNSLAIIAGVLAVLVIIAAIIIYSVLSSTGTEHFDQEDIIQSGGKHKKRPKKSHKPNIGDWITNNVKKIGHTYTNATKKVGNTSANASKRVVNLVDAGRKRAEELRKQLEEKRKQVIDKLHDLPTPVLEDMLKRSAKK